jgi:hypothetical protein
MSAISVSSGVDHRDVRRDDRAEVLLEIDHVGRFLGRRGQGGAEQHP